MRIGIDLGGTKIEGIVLKDDGALAKKIRVDVPGWNYEQTVSTVCDLIKQLQAEAEDRLPVGIGTPGALSTPDELMKNCNSIRLNGRPLKRDIETALGYTVRLENDANCFALSEAHYGAAANAATMFGVIIGTGTGGGIVVNKTLLTGPNGIAGEWGHNPVPSSVLELMDGDRHCYCGRRNCIETVLSGRGLKQTFLELRGIEMNAAEIAVNAADDPAAAECIQLYCQQLARCLAVVVNVVDPYMIVLGGGLSNISELYRSVPGYMESHVFTDVMRTKLSPPRFGDASGARGAACLWSIDGT